MIDFELPTFSNILLKRFRIATYLKTGSCKKYTWKILFIDTSLRNPPWQSAIPESFAEANSVFIVITSAKILPRWLFPSKIYIQFTIFNTYFSTKLLFTNKRYHLQVSVCATGSVNHVFTSLFILFLLIHMAIEQGLLSCLISLYWQNSITPQF